MATDAARARHLVADRQAGEMHDIKDSIEDFLAKEGPSMPADLRGMLEGLHAQAYAVSMAFAGRVADAEAALERAEKVVEKRAA